MKTDYLYNKSFYQSVDARAQNAASVSLKILEDLKVLPHEIKVTDIGCGSGIWLSVFQHTFNCIELVGVDLPEAIAFQKNNKQYFENSKVKLIATDLCSPDLTLPSADVGICTEVLEHLPRDCADLVFQNMLNSYECIIFSAAQPGQGGTHHINERPLNYWAAKAQEQNYAVFDIFRSSLLNDRSVARFYAHNLILIVKNESEIFFSITKNLQIRPTYPLEDTKSNYEIFRYMVLRLLPHKIVTALSKYFSLK